MTTTLLLTRASCTAFSGHPQLNSIAGLLLHRPSVFNDSTVTISTSASCDGKFNNNFKANMTATNPLLDGPDYSYADGRQVPLGANLRSRLIRQRALVEDALRLLGEMQYAKDRHQGMSAETQQQRDHTIASKLQHKAHLKLDPSTGELQGQRGHGEGNSGKRLEGG